MGGWVSVGGVGPPLCFMFQAAVFIECSVHLWLKVNAGSELGLELIMNRPMYTRLYWHTNVTSLWAHKISTFSPHFIEGKLY